MSPLAPLKIAAAGLAVFSALGQIRQGIAAKQLAGARSDLLNQEALREEAAAKVAGDRIRRDADSLFATARARAAKSGAKVGEGSPLLVAVNILAEGELEAARAREAGDVAAFRKRQEAKFTKKAGSNAQTGSFFRAGQTLLQAGGTGAFGTIG